VFAHRVLGDVRGGWDAPEAFPRAWATINGVGTGAGTAFLIESFNTSSVTDNGAGDYTLTWTTAFKGTEYVVAGFGKSDGGASAMLGVSNLSAVESTSIRMFCRNADTAATDTPIAHVIAFGRQ
jgi:hypothetical protein